MTEEGSTKKDPDYKPTAFERWEMPALLEQDEIDQQARLVEQLPTLEEMEKIRADAYEEGFAAGRKEGAVAGLKEGRKLSQKKLSELVSAFNKPLKQQDDRLESVLLDMTLHLSRGIIQRELSVDSDSVNHIVREVFELIELEEGKFRVQLNPEDIKRVAYFLEKEYAAEVNYQLIEDDKVKQGGCIIRSDAHYVDAQVETRITAMLDDIYKQQNEPPVEILEDQFASVRALAPEPNLTPTPASAPKALEAKSSESSAKAGQTANEVTAAPVSKNTEPDAQPAPLSATSEQPPRSEVAANASAEGASDEDQKTSGKLQGKDSASSGIMSATDAEKATKVDLSDMPFFDEGSQEP